LNQLKSWGKIGGMKEKRKGKSERGKGVMISLDVNGIGKSGISENKVISKGKEGKGNGTK